MTTGLSQAVARAVQLRSSVPRTGSAEAAWISRALRELDCAHEELQVANEELLEQVSELWEREQQLEHERYRMRELFEGAPDAYIVTSLTGIVIELNRRASELLNVQARFIKQAPLSVLVSKSDQALLLKTLHGFGARPACRELELSLLKSGGRGGVIATSVRVCRVPDIEHQNVLCWILREHGETTAPKQERPSARASDADVHEADRHLSLVAHELRNPLAVLAGWVTFLRTAGSDEVLRRRALDTIHSYVHGIAAQVEDVLDHVRLTEDALLMNVDEIELPSLVERAYDEARSVAEQRQIRLSVQLDPELPRVRGDARRLHQALSNLLSNALRHTPAAGAIEVSGRKHDAEVELAVTDNGVGIASEDLERIFQPFTRDPRQPTGLGFGLGLSIARRIVQLHGGRLVAESAGAGSGATFRMQLPAVRAQL